MSETIRFHFDPLCPWAWQGSKWIREVEKVRDVEVEWRLFSLKLVNEGKEDPLRDKHAKGTPALRTLALVDRTEGNAAVGDVYKAIGERVHEQNDESSPEVVQKALADAGIDPDLMHRALDDDVTMEDVRSQHDAAVREAGCFGVPTIVLPNGKGIFGPVLSTAPEGEEAGELWDRVLWLTEKGYFFELKRDRDRRPGE